MAVLKDLIVHGPSRFINGAKFNTINAESIGANEGIFNKLIATSLDAKEATIDNLTTTNAKVVGMLDVQGELHTNAWTNANIANIGGSFYITPTVEAVSGTISITRVSATSWTIAAAGSFATDFIKSGTSASGVAWPANSLVLITGNVTIGNLVYPLGTLKGTLSSAVTASAASTSKTITITGVTDAQNNATPAVLQELYELNNNANISGATFSNGKISLYKLGSYPIGIQMSSMGTSANSLIEIYGGVSTNPSVRIGHLAGAPAVNGTSPTGWGIYTDNGYFSGTIVSSSGKIGNWSITNSSIQTDSFGSSGMYFGSSGISLGSTFKVTNAGVLTATSGTIGGFSLNANSFYYKNATPGTSDDTVVLYPQGIVSAVLEEALVSGSDTGTSTTGTIEWDLTIGKDFGVTANGKLYARGAVISGQLLVSDDTDTNLVTQKEANEQHAALTANINKNTSSINTTNSNLNTLNTLVKQYLDSTIQKKNMTNLSSTAVAKILMGLNINNSYSIGIGSDRISFGYQLKEFAYISNAQMYINNIQLVNSMQMGDKFKWVASTNRLTLMRI